jgi:hypothetical protein
LRRYRGDEAGTDRGGVIEDEAGRFGAPIELAEKPSD